MTSLFLNELNNIYVGDVEVSRIYLGSEVIYEPTPLSEDSSDET
jgi:hypothetical protein